MKNIEKYAFIIIMQIMVSFVLSSIIHVITCYFTGENIFYAYKELLKLMCICILGIWLILILDYLKEWSTKNPKDKKDNNQSTS
mgnify:CR=1 FL=1